MRRLLGALGAASLAAGIAPAGEPPSGEAIEALVARLGDSGFRTREEAGRQLLARGPAAIPALERASTHPDAEIRTRAADLAERLRRAEESARLVATKMVRLDFTNVPLGTALADLKAKTGIPLALDPALATDSLRPVTVRTGDLPAWEAVEAFCRAAGLCEVFHEDFGGPTGNEALVQMLGGRRKQYYPSSPQPGLTAGQVPVVLADGQAALAGDRSTAVRVLALPAKFPGNRVIRGAGQVVINLDVAPLPGLKWEDATAVRVTKAEDETGRPLFAAFHGEGRPTGGPVEEVVFWGGGGGQIAFLNGGDVFSLPQARPNPRIVPVALKTDDRSIAMLKVFEGVVVGEVTLPNQTLLMIEDLTKVSGQIIRGPSDLALAVVSYDRQSDGQIAVKVRLDGPNPWAAQRAGRRAAFALNGGMAWEGGAQAGVASRFRFYDHTGSAMPTPTVRMTSSTDDGFRQTAEYVFVFPRTVRERPPVKMEMIGEKSAMVEVPFRMANVRLP